eukprot:Skav214572  [mRNA]  locus=scaffold57:18013:23045:+ [translate_table: standard]
MDGWLWNWRMDVDVDGGEVIDNGRGISAEDFDKVASRHATSKIREYADLSSGDFSSFGFRGEALSAISAMGDMTIATKTRESPASLLCYDRYGKLVSSSPIAREVGTTGMVDVNVTPDKKTVFFHNEEMGFPALSWEVALARLWTIKTTDQTRHIQQGDVASKYGSQSAGL